MGWKGLIEEYRTFLPVTEKTPVVTLQEGNTPLIHARHISSVVGEGVEVYLKYEGNKSVLTQIERVSTPGRRVYTNRKSIPIALGGYGVTLVSTSGGILTDR